MRPIHKGATVEFSDADKYTPTGFGSTGILRYVIGIFGEENSKAFNGATSTIQRAAWEEQQGKSLLR